MLLVAYFGGAPADQTCYACDDKARYTIVAVDGQLRDFACEAHTAEHMLGNAVALAGEEVLASAAS